MAFFVVAVAGSAIADPRIPNLVIAGVGLVVGLVALLLYFRPQPRNIICDTCMFDDPRSCRRPDRGKARLCPDYRHARGNARKANHAKHQGGQESGNRPDID